MRINPNVKKSVWVLCALALAAALLTTIFFTGAGRPAEETAASLPGPSSSQPESSVSSEAEPSSRESSEQESAEASEPESLPPSSEEASSRKETPSSKAPASSQQSSSAPASSKPAPPPSSAPEPVIPAPPPSVPAGNGRAVVGYYASWGRGAGYPATSLPADMLTHVNYAFADIGTDGRLRLPNSKTDRQNFADLRTLKSRNPGLKTLISVGGWDYSSNFSLAASTAQTRQTFAQSCLDFILEHGFDGVDLDWEFPSSKDKNNFTLLMQAIRAKFNEQSAIDGRRYLLTAAVSPGAGQLRNLDAPALAEVCDYLFLMGYDMHGPWDSYADLTAPLYAPKEPSPHYVVSVSGAVDSYINAGVPAGKLVLGMPFYGYRYTTYGGGLYDRFSSSKSVSFDNIRSQYLSNPAFTRYFHEAARVPYLFDGTTFLSYDDEASIAEKAAYAKNAGLGGVGAWELSQDKNSILLSAAWNALMS